MIKRTQLKFKNRWFLSLQITTLCEESESYIHAYIIDMSGFQKHLNHRCSLSVSIFNSKLVEVVMNCKKCYIFKVLDPFSQNKQFWSCNIFFTPNTYFPVISIFSVVIPIYKIHVFDGALYCSLYTANRRYDNGKSLFFLFP